MQSILKTLTKVPAPSGSETLLCKTIQSLLPDDTTFVDAHGTLLYHKKGEGNGTVILTAMDTPCLYVTYPENGFARFSAVGGLKPREGMIVLCQNDIIGVIGKDEQGFYIDTGCHELAIGQWAVPLPSFHPMDEDKYCGTSLGQYATIAASVFAAMQSTAKDAWFVFATKSHIRQMSPSFMQKISANRLISVEVSAANDSPGEKTIFASLGKGTTLRVKDENMLSSPSLISELSSVPFKTYREVSTLRGIGGAVQKAYGGIQSVGIGIPTRNVGSGGEVVSLSDIQNTADILTYLLR